MAGLAPPATAAPACPPAHAPVLERLISAACADCWSQAPAQPKPAPAQAWVFDWIVPAASDAPLAAAALLESAERAGRLGHLAGTLPAQALQPARSAGAGAGLKVGSGPAWNGYFGLEFRLPAGASQRLPAGSTGWLALVEQVRAGSDGAPVARALVRSVAGPLPLDALGAPAGAAANQPLTHLRALRWPAGAEPTRLQARAWIEGPDGTILAVAADQCRPP